MRHWVIAAGFLACLLAGPVSAGDLRDPERDSVLDPSVLRIDEPRYLGQPLDAATRLVGADGQPLVLGDWLGKPVILLLSYYSCDGSCPTMNANLARVLQQLGRYRLGRDYRVLTVSFDPHDSPETAHHFVAMHVPDAAALRDGWRHVVLAEGGDAPRRFAASVGFRYFWSQEEGMFLHPNVLIFLTPQGRVARYIYGTSMDADTLQRALVEADWSRISTSGAVFDMLTGACYSYSYQDGRYRPNYSLIAGVASFVLGITITGLGAWVYRRKMARGVLSDAV